MIWQFICIRCTSIIKIFVYNIEKSEEKSRGEEMERAEKKTIWSRLFLLAVLAMVFVMPARAAGEQLRVQFLDVGQGNAVLLESQGHYVLIDGGDRETSSFVVSYLEDEGIDTFDYVVASHYDSDHLAGLIGVLHQFGVNQLLTPDYVGDTKLYQSFAETVSQYEILEHHPQQEEVYSFGSAQMEILGPVYYGHSDENEDSICIRVTNGENRFLICGDIGEDTETELVHTGVDLKADVYLLNHHGSDTSSTQEFLDLVQPSSIVISCGAGNSYGHPGAETMARIAAFSPSVYRTDLQGTIRVESDGVNLRWEQEPCSDFTPGTSEDAGYAEEEGKISEVNGGAEADSQGTAYVLNINSMKFHVPSCSAAARIKAENRQEYVGNREELIQQGYSPCGICHP